jgi:hypothetical protein
MQQIPAAHGRIEADKDRSAFLKRKFIIEPHFAGRKSLL